MKFLLLAFKLELRFFQLWPSRLAMKWTRILEDCASSWITSTSRTRTWIDQEPTKTNVASNFYSRRFSLKWLSGEIWRNTSWRKWHRILEKQITKRITRLYSSSCRMEEIAIASWELTGGRQPWRIWMSEFRENKCLSLKHKPKVFIIQTCRGCQRGADNSMPSSANDISLQVVTTSSREQKSSQPCGTAFSTDSTLPRSVFPPEADFVLAFATAPGYVSYRDPHHGAWFIQVRNCQN